MFNLDNISVKELFHLQDDQLFEQYMRFSDEEDGFYLKPKEVFAGREATPLGSLTYGEVATIKQNLVKPTFDNLYETFDLVFKVKKITYLAQDVVSYLYALNWIKAEIKMILEREKKTLGGTPDPLLEAAGVHRLVPFGELNTILAIAQKYGKSPEEVENWKYNLVFSMMVHDKVSGEVQTEYNRLKYGSKSKA